MTRTTTISRYSLLYISILMILITGFAAGGCEVKAEPRKQPLPSKTIFQVNAVKTEVPKGSLSFEYSGVVVPRQTTAVSFQLNGNVSRIFVEEGDVVTKGQKLAVIDNSRFLSAYRAALAMDQQAEDAQARLKQVYDKGSLPEIKWQEVTSKLQQAEASLQLAQQNLKECKLVAPSDGVVSNKRIETGTNVTPNVTVLDVVQLDSVYIRISVPENEIPYMKVGQPGAVTIPAIGSRVFKGEVGQIGVSASPLSKTYEVKILVKNHEHVIKPGMAAVAKLEIEQQHHLPTVPLRAVQQSSEGAKFVYFIDEKSKKAIRRDVELGGFYKNNVYVTKGIQGGELVVVDGQHKLDSNTEVEFRLLK